MGERQSRDCRDWKRRIQLKTAVNKENEELGKEIIDGKPGYIDTSPDIVLFTSCSSSSDQLQSETERRRENHKLGLAYDSPAFSCRRVFNFYL